MKNAHKSCMQTLSFLLTLAMLIGMIPSTVFAVGGSKPKDLKFNMYRLEISENKGTPISTVTDFSMTAATIGGEENTNQINYDVKQSAWGYPTTSDPWKYASEKDTQYMLYMSAYGTLFAEKTVGQGAQLAIQVLVEEAGCYEITPLLGQSELSGIVDIYVAPVEAENKTADTYKVGSKDMFSKTNEWNVPVAMRRIYLEAGTYEVTFRISGRNAQMASSEAARALVGGINFIGMEEADTPDIATTSTQIYNLMVNDQYTLKDHTDAEYNKKILPLSEITFDNVLTLGGDKATLTTAPWAFGGKSDGALADFFSSVYGYIFESYGVADAWAGIKLRVPASGYYTPELIHGLTTDSGITRVYIAPVDAENPRDTKYSVGHVDNYNSGSAVWGQRSKFETIYLKAGDYLMSFAYIGENDALTGNSKRLYFKQIQLNGVDPKNTMPEISSLEAESAGTIGVGDDTSVGLTAVMSDASIEDLWNADIAVTSGNDQIATAEAVADAKNLTRVIKITGVGGGDTTIRVSVTLSNGAVKDVNIPVTVDGGGTSVIPATSTQIYNLMVNDQYTLKDHTDAEYNKKILPLSEITFDNVLTLGGDKATLTTAPWAFGGKSGGALADFFSSVYGYIFESYGVADAWAGIKLRVPMSGYYTPELIHGLTTDSGITRVYIAPVDAENPRDTKYSVGHVDNYNSGSAVWGQRSKFETIYLKAGDYLMSFAYIGENDALTGNSKRLYFKQIQLNGVDPKNTMPKISSLEAESAGALCVGGDTSVGLTAVMSDASIEDLWNADIAVTSGNDQIATAEAVADAKNLTRMIKISGTGEGDTTIHVSVTLSNGAVKDVDIPVTVDTGLISVALKTPEGQFEVGKTYQASVTGTMSNQAAADLSGAEITYESAKSDVATIDRDGTITPISEGETEISVTVSLNGNTRTAKQTISVIDPDASLTAINVESGLAPGKNLLVGSTSKLVVTGTLSNGKPAYMPYAAIDYAIVEGEDVVSIDDTGAVTGLKEGEATIQVTAALRGVTKKETVKIRVELLVQRDMKFSFAGLGELFPLEKLTIEDYGFEINRAKTSQTALNAGGGAGFRTQSYGLQSQIVSPNQGKESETAIDFEVPVGGPFLFAFSGGQYSGGAIADIYIDDLYVGTYDFYSAAGALNGGNVNMRSINLSTGRHTATIRSVDQTEGSWSYAQYIGNLMFYKLDEMPTLDTFTASVAKNNLSIGEKSNVHVEAIMSTGTVVSFGNHYDGSEDENLKLTFESSDSEIIAVDQKGNLTPKAAGKATITVTIVVDGETKSEKIPITVSDAKIQDIAVTVTPDEIYAGRSAAFAATVTLDNGEVIDNSNLEITAESSNADVFTVNGFGINAVAPGTAELIIRAAFNNSEKIKRIPISIKEPVLKTIEASFDKVVLRPNGDTAQMTVAGKTNIGTEQNLDGAVITYTSRYPEIAEVSDTGVVTAIALGRAVIDIKVTFQGITIAGSASIMVSNGKSGSSFYTKEKIENARENVAKYAWARSQKDTAESAANRYIGKENELWNIVSQEGVPRSATVGFQDDPNAYICAYCGVDLRAKHSVYPWISDPLNTPWKVQCPDCRRYFPSNDFANYYKLGIDENGKYNKDLAKQKNDELVAKGEDGYLKNILYPEKGEGWGVDDGYGYQTGTVFANGVSECKTWIAYYNHWGLWYTTGGNNPGLIVSALGNLKNAYLFTGDIRYGRLGAILIDRVADVYPDYDLWPYGSANGVNRFYNSHGGTFEGKTIGRIWETETAREFALAYDAFYPLMDDPYVINFLSEKAAEYHLENPKSSGDLIRKNCEDGILRSIYDGCKKAQIHGNFGMHQSTLATAAVVLDTLPETKEWIDWVMQSGGYQSNHTVTGGNVLVQLVDKINRDGHGEEGAAGYNYGWLTNVLLVAEATKGYQTYEAADLYKNPKLIKMISAFNQMTLGYAGRNYATAQIGDSGSTANYKTYITPDNAFKGYSATRDPLFAQMAYWANNDSVEGLHEDIFTKDPNAIQDEIAEVIKTQGELNLSHSYNMVGNGFTILRDGEFINSDNAAHIVDTRRDFWIYYGRNTNHGHADALNLGIEAFGMNMAPDLGYPEATGNDPNRSQWVNNTISHNTVVVDEARQTNIAKPAKLLHYDDADHVKIMDVSSPLSYKAADIYRRTVVMVEVSDEVSYGIDFFRVKGGSDHTYSFHSQSKEIYETEGLNLIEQKDANGNWIGSYAGADVAWGANSTYMNGYSWLKKVRKASNPQTGTFAVDFKITDFREVLPYDQDLHLRMTMLNHFDLSEVAIVEGTPPRISGNPDALEYVLARRHGRDLDSLFTTVFEPYKDERYIASLEAVPDENITVKSGTEGKSDVVRAVKVTLKNGRNDYIVYATNNSVLYNIDNTFDFRGAIGVYSTLNGELHTAYVNDGDVIGETFEEPAAYTGTIVDFTRDLVFDNTITVSMSGDYDIDRLAGNFIYVENGKKEGNAVYPIESAIHDASGNVVLNLGNTTLIERYADSNNLSAGYIYNIAENNTFRIPLGNQKELAPVFTPLEQKNTEVGAMLTFTVSASSPVGRDVTISASSLPYGAQFDEKTNTFSWSASFGSIGMNYAKFIATDGVNNATLTVPVKVYNSAAEGGSSSINNTPGSSTSTDKPIQPDKPVVTTEKDEVSFAAGTNETTEATKLGSVTFADGTFAADGQGKLKIEREGETYTVSVTATVDMEQKPAKVSLAYTPAGNMTDENCIIVKDENGNIIPNGRYENGKMTFYTDTFGKFTIEYNPKSFTDLGNHAWASGAITRLAARGIINGITATTYGPAKNITRADFTTLIVRAFGFTAESASFADVPASAYYAEPVGIAKTLGIVGGVNATDFAPTSEITRQDMMVIVARALEKAGYVLDASENPEFSDIDEVADYAKNAVEILTRSGLIAGSNGKVNPKGNTTRAEVAVILDRILFMQK